ncbi:lysophospholipid acyltransferase family protein [Chitinibacter sp. S2-10]|uniref:lysophospholipid acyltransferase family protein n=1 Tax=Chitinibacter sp. S2-10 TaxID=3373597 RepID=UPI00397797C8
MTLRLLLALTWLIHWLPFRVMQWLAIPLGHLLYLALKKRRHIGQTNLRLCFPEWDEKQRAQILRQHFIDLCSTILAYSILLHASPARLYRLIQIEGIENVEPHQGQALILLCPHFLGLDFGGVLYTEKHKGASMYAEQRGAFHQLSLKIRSRFNDPILIKRTDGIRPIVRALKAKLPFYYLPDQDMGAQQSIFSPFFGIQTATLPMLGKLAEMTGAAVVPIITTVGRGHFVSRFYPAWDNFPSGDLQQDTDRMNAFIEDIARQYPSQYYWLHRRFKTRPEGEAGFY